MLSQQISGNNAQQRRQVSARYPTMNMKTADNRTASNSLNRQQQSGTNLHMIGKPVQGSNPKKMKLIRTRPSGSNTCVDKQSTLKSPASPIGMESRGGRNKISQGRQPSLSISSNQFMKGPATASAPHTTTLKNHQNSGRVQQPQQSSDGQFMFSATSPHVQINKQAVLGNSQQQRPVTGKNKESLGHITASRRQKQAGLQINVEGCQSIVINQPSRGHVVASPGGPPNVPDNMLFYGQNSTMSPQSRQQHESLNQASPKVAPAAARRTQQASSMSKKQMRSKANTSSIIDNDGLKNQQNLQLAPNGHNSGLQTTYQITPKHAGQSFDQIGGPRSTKARASQNFTKGRFIDTANIMHAGGMAQQQHATQQSAASHGVHSPSCNQPSLSTLEQQKYQKQQYKHDGSNQESGQMLFLQSPPKRGNLVSPSNTAARTSTHANFSSARAGSKPSVKVQKGHHHSTNPNNSTLGIKTANTQSHSNTLKIQNLRVYNETSTAGMPQTKNSVTTKHETTTTKRYAMRNNFTAPGVTDSWGGAFSPDNKGREQQTRTTQSGMRQFHNQSSSSGVGYGIQGSTTSNKPMGKKRKLTLNQRAGGGGPSSIRPMSGAVRGPASRGQNQSYQLRTNVTYASPLNQQQAQSINVQSNRQSTVGTLGKNIQILAPNNMTTAEQQQQQQLQQQHQGQSQQPRVYSPNAAMNGRRDINQELKNLAVPQFYPSTTVNSQAPRHIQFTRQPGQQQQSQIQSQVPQQPMNEASSSCLMEEPELVIDAKSTNINSQSNGDQSKKQMQGAEQYSEHHYNHHAQNQISNMVSTTQLSMDQPAHQFASQQVALNQSRQNLLTTEGTSDRARRQSIQNQQNTANVTQLTNFDGSSELNNGVKQQLDQSRTSTGRNSNQQRQNSQQMKNSSRANLATQSQYTAGSKGVEIRGTTASDKGGSLIIPNFAINLPQSTTAATAPKLSTDNMLLALDPIQKNNKDINQKLQQRKIDSARQALDQQANTTAAQKKPSNNLQVIVTHEIKPTANLQNAGVLKLQPATTTNALKAVPSLDFQQQVQNPTLCNRRPSHQTQQQPQSSTNVAAVGANDLNTSAQSRQQSQRDSTRNSRQANSYRQSNPMVNPSTYRSNPAQGDANGSKQQVVSKTIPSQPSPKRAKASQSNKPAAQATISSTAEIQVQSQTTTQSNTMYSQQVKIPMTPAKCLKQFGARHLTDYEKTEILDFPQVYFFGESVKKIQAQRPPISQNQSNAGRDSSKNRQAQQQREEEEDNNCGYDDSKGNYKVVMKDHIAYRYEVVEHLGRGSFGVAVKCFDHKTQEFVALKIIKNKKKYYYQAGVELKILQFLKDNDPDDTMNIIHMKDYVIFRKHLCISFELMSINLYEFLKLNEFEGLSLSLVRRFAIQLLYSLKFLKENDVIHCDLKPENILLKDPSKSGIKIIDFGSSCFQDERVYTYIQSRFYRAPEIVLGIPYTPCIDMWSFGCIMAEFAMGYPIFPGEDETDQISLIMEVCGIPPAEVLAKGQRKTKFFNETNMPKMVPNSRGKVRKPGTKVLEDILECSDQSFVNFVERCLEWDPEKRMTPDEAIRHQWILEGLPAKVLVHHQKLHNINTKSLPEHIRQQRAEYLASQPLDVQQEFRDEDEEEDSQSTVSYHQQQNQRGRVQPQTKSKSLDRTAGHTNLNSGAQGSGGGGHPLILKNKRPVKQGSLQNQYTSSGTRHRPSQSFDSTAQRNTNVSANVNASQHHNLRAKKQTSGVYKASGNEGKPTVEQMLHGSQRQ